MDDSSLWYYLADEQRHGPVSFNVIRQLVEIGHLHHDSHVIQTGASEWTKVKDVAELKGYLPKEPATPKVKEPEVAATKDSSKSRSGKKKRSSVEPNRTTRRIGFFRSRSFEFKWGFLLLLTCVSGAIALQFVDLADLLPAETDPLILEKPVYAWCFAVSALNTIPFFIYLITLYFKNGVGWGLACIFIPFAAIFYIIGYWDQMWRAILLSIINNIILFFCFYQFDPEAVRLIFTP